MAKWGEGDPRWIVEERPDSTNVNNWHWTEKNATEWSKNKLKELLVPLSFSDACGTCQTSEVTSIEGEAVANNRKAKLIFFYELVLKLKWTGKTASGTAVNGTITIPNLSEENTPDEVDVEVVLTSDSTSERQAIKDLMRKQGTPAIRARIAQWIKALKEEYAVDLIKPTAAAGPSTSQGGAAMDVTAAAAPGAAAVAAATAASKSGKPASMGLDNRKIEITEDFKCTASDLYLALVDEGRVRAYTQSEAKINANAGGEFMLFGGNVLGSYTELIPNEKIVMKWRFRSWAEGLFSDVVITIKEGKDSTKLQLVQTGVPYEDFERTMVGWRSQQFERMKMILGFGDGLNLSF